MTKLPYDNFIYDLKRLVSAYKDYADYKDYVDILEQLIVELEQGKIEKIRFLLQQSSDW